MTVLARVTTSQREPAAWGMLLFITSEAALFALVFASYFYIRSGATSWPPEGVDAPKLVVPFIETGILLLSSATIAWAEAGARERREGQLRAGLALTFLLGAIFLVLLGSEYAREEMALDDSAYASLFFVITGFHGAHVIAGLLMNGYIQLQSWTGRRTRLRHTAVTNIAWYWHFVDVIWLFVLLTVYLSPHFLGEG